MRLQLTRSGATPAPTRAAARLGGLACAWAASVVVVVGAGVPAAAAQVGFSSTTTIYDERGGPLHTTVITPSAALTGTVDETFTVRAGYEADVVTGASVAVVDAPGAEVDAVTSATQYDDVRHTARGSLSFASEMASFGAAYAYGTESDYRAHTLTLNARAELFDRNTAFDVSYVRGQNSVCLVADGAASEAVDQQRLPNSDGCFTAADDRRRASLGLHVFQLSWTQAWTRALATQLTASAEIQDGYQGNPYRAVWLGASAAREYHPSDRARYAAGLGVRWFIEPLGGAVQLYGRAYRDTWDVESLTLDVGYEQPLGDVRVRARARYYTQTAAVFFSDDYTREPRGQYFTGDRELAAMRNVTVGGRIVYAVPPGDDGDVIGFLSSLELLGKFDALFLSFPDFRYGAAPVPNDLAIAGTVGLDARF